MLKNSHLISFVIGGLLSFSALSSECKTYNTRYIQNKIFRISKEKICVTISANKKFSKATSKNCEVPIMPSCPFKAVTKGPDFESFIKEMGSPGFHLCHSLGGSPQLYEIQIAEKWMPFERCYWKNSTEFTDIDDLIGHYKAL